MSTLQDLVQLSRDYYSPNHKNRPVKCGTLSAAGFRLHSMRCKADDGLDALWFYVCHESGCLFLGYQATRKKAVAMARRFYKKIGPEAIAAAIAEEIELRKVHAEAINEWWRRHYDAENAARRAAKITKPRATVITARRRRIFNKSGGKCHYCATDLELTGRWHIEHMMPRSLDGSSEDHNLVAACASCNQAKKDKTDLEFIAELDRPVAA